MPLPALSAVLTASAVAHAGPGLCAWSAAVRRLLGVRARLADAGAVALTFDDGPDPRATPATLELLANVRATATFFLVGEQVRRDPGLAREIVAAGHEVGVHCDRHRNLLRLAPPQVFADLRRARAAITDATGADPSLYRPPYGVLTGAALAHVRAQRWRTVLWSRWGRDWRAAATAESIAAEAASALRGGEIVLLHDSDRYGAPGCWRAMLAALPRILAAVESAGLRATALSPALGAGDHRHGEPIPVRQRTNREVSSPRR